MQRRRRQTRCTTSPEAGSTPALFAPSVRRLSPRLHGMDPDYWPDPDPEPDPFDEPWPW